MGKTMTGQVLIKDLPNRKDLIGKRINVKRQGGKYHYDYQDKKKMRVFLGARTYTEKGIKWVEWNWMPEPIENEDTYYSDNHDCGYSGIGLGSDLWDSSYLEIN